jgi:dTMP kinase
MTKYLQQGGTIIANRYVTSNLAHQSAKFQSRMEKEKFINWINELEYTVNKMPKEDMVIYLQVPPEISQKLIAHKQRKTFLKSQSFDIHEADKTYLQNTYQVYNELVKQYPHWQTIECINKNGKLLTPAEIHAKLLNLLHDKKIL